MNDVVTALLVKLAVEYKIVAVSMVTVVMLTVVVVDPVNGGSGSTSSQNSPINPYMHSQSYEPGFEMHLDAPSAHGLYRQTV